MHVAEFEQHADSTFIIEEIIESNDQILQEEIIYEEDEQLENEQPSSEQRNIESAAAEAVDTQMAELLASPVSDYVKMDHILKQLEGNHRRLAERRIMAFVLKCQLRALVDEPIDDLLI